MHFNTTIQTAIYSKTKFQKGTDNTMKKFFNVTKYLWFGGIIGVLQQALGDLNNITYNGKTIIDFAEIFTGLAFYAAVILFVIKRDVKPTQQLRDILLFFIGLDLFYYLYTFVIHAYLFMTDPSINGGLINALTSYEIEDFIYWTTIGLAAAIWSLVATKLRNMDKKVLYIIMLIPLFAVMAAQFVGATFSTIMFFITGGELVSVPWDAGDHTIYTCLILSALTALVSFILCLYKFLKKSNVKKLNAQEA